MRLLLRGRISQLLLQTCPKLISQNPTGPGKAKKLLESLIGSVPMASLLPTSAKSNIPSCFTQTQPGCPNLQKVELPVQLVHNAVSALDIDVTSQVMHTLEPQTSKLSVRSMQDGSHNEARRAEDTELPIMATTESTRGDSERFENDLSPPIKRVADVGFIAGHSTQSSMTSSNCVDSFGCGSQNSTENIDSPNPVKQLANSGLTAPQRNTTSTVKVKKEPCLAEVRQATLRRKHTKQQPDEQRWRLDSPPISCLDTVKKRRWPPQYVSPSPASPSKKPCKRRVVRDIRAAGVASRSSSLELLSVEQVTPLQDRRSSCRAKRDICYAPISLSEMIKIAQIPTGPKTPKTAKTTTKIKKAVHKPATPPPQLLQSKPLAAKGTTCHFFLFSDNLGAIPVALSECTTASAFFGRARAAWSLIGSGDQAGSLVAVSVSIDRFSWPLVLPWGDATAFERLRESITIAEAGNMGGLEVHVKCLQA